MPSQYLTYEELKLITTNCIGLKFVLSQYLTYEELKRLALYPGDYPQY